MNDAQQKNHAEVVAQFVLAAEADGELTPEAAVALAGALHRGQTDKAGFPYFTHPLRVARRAMTAGRERGCGERELAQLYLVGVLHDALEDTPLTADELAAMKIDPAVLEALHLLNHSKRNPQAERSDYARYIRRLGYNDLARHVKLADLADNTDPDRQARLSEAAQARSRDKYGRAQAFLRSIEELESEHPPGSPRWRLAVTDLHYPPAVD